MDYLMSLVGKDQDTITEAIKELAENADKVKAQEKEISDMHSELDKAKENIHFLKNKLDQKYDVIEDLEHDLDQIEEKSRMTKKELESKQNEFEQLENFTSERLEEIEILRDNNQSMISQISENVRMENKINIQDKIIKELKDKLKETDEFQNQQEEVKKLFDDIEHLKEINELKEVQLKEFVKENELLKLKLTSIEMEKRRLSQEHEPRAGENLKCGECDIMFENPVSLKCHMESVHKGRDTKLMKTKLRLHEIERNILEQKLKLTKKIYKLKEYESNRRETCSCQGWCGINHTKHNWKTSRSETIMKLALNSGLSFDANDVFEKNENETDTGDIKSKGHQCQNCEQTFPEIGRFVNHIEKSHKLAAVMFLD